MYLNRLYIENYRSIKKLDLKFEKGKNVIVGKNNSGKSNIVKAIDLILGESSPTWEKSENIADNDFFEGNTENEIFIWCELQREDNESLNLSDLKGAFFKVMDKKSPNNPKKIEINFSNLNKEHIFEFCTDEGQARIDNNEFGKIWIGTKPYCKGHGFEDELNEMANFAFAFRCKKEDGKYIKHMLFLYKKSGDTDWFFGINADRLRNELLQSAVIPSFRDPKDQLRIAHYTWYGKLLRAYIKEDDTNLNNAFDKVRDASNQLFEELQNKITCKKTQIAFPNTKISFQFNPDTKQDIYKSVLIYVDDGFKSKLEEKGSGIQSTVIIGLFDYYVRNISHTKGSLLAIEEPEIYLHPHGRRVISERLDAFLDDGKNQVILTTHAPEFICTPHENINLIVVRKDKETVAQNFNFNDIKIKQIFIKKQNAEMFFADAVILVEGADKYILESIAEQMGEETKIKSNENEEELGKKWLDNYNVSIINCGGKTEFWKYVKVFNELNIHWLIIADFDFLRDGLDGFFTKLSYEQSFKDTLNSLNSKIQLNRKYKSISDIVDDKIKQEIRQYILKLSKENNIHILTGELENFYIQKPKYDKEQGIIETISKSIEDDKKIDDYVRIDEFLAALKVFIEKCLKLKITK